MGNKKQILVGAAKTFLGPSIDPTTGPGFTAYLALKAATTVKQADHLALAGQVSAGWSYVGYTQDGLEISTDPSWGEVEVDQLLDSAKIFKDGMGLSISTTFAEATLENLLIAWGQASGTLTSSASEKNLDIEGGSLGEAPVERGLIAVGNAPEKVAPSNQYAERTYFAFRVLSVESSAHTLSRSEATVIPVTFRALPADNGKYGSVRDRLFV